MSLSTYVWYSHFTVSFDVRRPEFIFVPWLQLYFRPRDLFYELISHRSVVGSSNSAESVMKTEWFKSMKELGRRLSWSIWKFRAVILFECCEQQQVNPADCRDSNFMFPKQKWRKNRRSRKRNRGRKYFRADEKRKFLNRVSVFILLFCMNLPYNNILTHIFCH